MSDVFMAPDLPSQTEFGADGPFLGSKTFWDRTWSTREYMRLYEIQTMAILTIWFRCLAVPAQLAWPGRWYGYATVCPYWYQRETWGIAEFQPATDDSLPGVDIWYMIYIHIWYDMIWYDMIWYDMIWYDMIWYDMIWYDMIIYDIYIYIIYYIYMAPTINCKVQFIATFFFEFWRPQPLHRNGKADPIGLQVPISSASQKAARGEG